MTNALMYAVEAIVARHVPQDARERATEEIRSIVAAAENTRESWLTRNWRPVTLLAFVVFIAARWFGFAAASVSEEEALQVYGILEAGLVVYAAGRSIEKVAPSVVEAIKR